MIENVREVANHQLAPRGPATVQRPASLISHKPAVATVGDHPAPNRGSALAAVPPPSKRGPIAINTSSVAAPVVKNPSAEEPTAVISPLGTFGLQQSGNSDDTVGSDLRGHVVSCWKRELALKRASSTNRKDRAEAQMELGKALAQCKAFYVGKGREGQWASFLKTISIPRSSADRYVVRWNRGTSSPAAPPATADVTPEQLQLLLRRTVSSLAARLKTKDTVATFVEGLAAGLNAKLVPTKPTTE